MAQLELVEICRDEKNKAVVNLHGELAMRSSYCFYALQHEQVLHCSLGSMMEWT